MQLPTAYKIRPQVILQDTQKLCTILEKARAKTVIKASKNAFRRGKFKRQGIMKAMVFIGAYGISVYLSNSQQGELEQFLVVGVALGTLQKSAAKRFSKQAWVLVRNTENKISNFFHAQNH